jgi:hypothetical protein
VGLDLTNLIIFAAVFGSAVHDLVAISNGPKQLTSARVITTPQ